MKSATANSGDSSDSDVIQHKDSSVLRVVHKLQKKMKKQDKLIHQQDKWIREQRQQHSQIQDKVASLEDQSQQIAGETLEIPLESQSYYLLVFYSLNIYV